MYLGRWQVESMYLGRWQVESMYLGRWQVESIAERKLAKVELIDAGHFTQYK